VSISVEFSLKKPRADAFTRTLNRLASHKLSVTGACSRSNSVPGADDFGVHLHPLVDSLVNPEPPLHPF
jgi:hypothetical protein